jgi:hypothetical protein
MDLGAFFSVDEHLEALFEMRRPDYDLLEDIHGRLQSDRFLYTEDRVELLDSLGKIVSEREDLGWEIWERIAPDA